MLGQCTRCHYELWYIPERVLCIQSSPELNKTFVKELVINKLYDIGKIDDKLKNQSCEQVDDEMIPNSRHFLMKCIFNFTRLPNDHLIELYEERIAAMVAQEEEVRKMVIESRPSLRRSNSKLSACVASIPNGPYAFAPEHASRHSQRSMIRQTMQSVESAVLSESLRNDKSNLQKHQSIGMLLASQDRNFHNLMKIHKTEES